MRISDWSSDVCSSDLTAPRRGVDGAHHPEVDQSEATVRLHEQVAGVRVGMEEPVLEDHRQHHVDDASSEVRSVDARGVERLEIRSEEHTSELQSLMRISYAVFCLKKKKETQ